MTPTNVAKIAARKHQDYEFYSLSFPNDHVEYLVFALHNMARQASMWKWPKNIESGMRVAITKMNDRFKKLYTMDEVLVVVSKLLQRHCVMQWMIHESMLVWEPKTNKFSGENHVWAAVVEEEERALWYYVAGDPLWCELEVIFQGIQFGYASDSDTEKVESPEESGNANIVFNYGTGLDSVAVGEGNNQPQSPATIARAYCAVTLPDSPGSWNLGIGSPSRINPMRFASPTISSPSVKEVDEDAWSKAKKKQGNFQSQARKILMWGSSHGSPGGSSSASSPGLRGYANYGPFDPNAVKKEKD